MRRPSQIIRSTLASLTEENRAIYQSQREFLRFLERQGDLKRIQVPVSPAFEMTEICHRTLKAAHRAQAKTITNIKIFVFTRFPPGLNVISY